MVSGFPLNPPWRLWLGSHLEERMQRPITTLSPSALVLACYGRCPMYHVARVVSTVTSRLMPALHVYSIFSKEKVEAWSDDWFQVKSLCGFALRFTVFTLSLSRGLDKHIFRIIHTDIFAIVTFNKNIFIEEETTSSQYWSYIVTYVDQFRLNRDSYQVLWNPTISWPANYPSFPLRWQVSLSSCNPLWMSPLLAGGHVQSCTLYRVAL